MGIIFAIIIMITIIIKVKSLLLVYTSFTCLGVTVLGMAGVMAYIFRMQVSMNMIIMMMITFLDEVMDTSIMNDNHEHDDDLDMIIIKKTMMAMIIIIKTMIKIIKTMMAMMVIINILMAIWQ